MKELAYINFIITAIFAVCCSYQAIYTIVSLVKKQKKFVAKKEHKFAVIIAARNEELVLPQLIESIRWQKYPGALLDIFIVADNCTDNTANIARDLGCIVYERQNKEQVGKGYALNYLFSEIHKSHADAGYEAYVVFDADNILDENYIGEMNKVFDNGYRVITSYRNTKNYGDNWISAGYALWFLHDSRFMNNPRMTLGNSCVVAGTGFLVSAKLIAEQGGWDCFSLTEDMEFSCKRILADEKIGYAQDAIFYDEQPTQFGQSLVQRSRWIKGFLLTTMQFASRLCKRIVLEGCFSSFDMIMRTVPTCVISVVAAILNTAMFVFGIVTGQDMNFFVYTCVGALAGGYVGILLMGLLTVITERPRIKEETGRIVQLLFTYPFFIATYAFAFFVAIFTDVSWKPITHKVSDTARRMKNIDENIL